MSCNSLLGEGGHAGDAVLRLDLQETTGTTAVDSSGNGYDGTIIGMGANPTSTGGPNGYLPNAFYFDGDDDEVNCGDEAAFDSAALSAFAWVRYVADRFEGLITRDGTADERWKFVHAQTTGPQLRLFYDDSNGDATLDSADSLSKSTWVSAAFTRSAAGIVNFYLDGVVDSGGSQDGVGTPVTTSSNPLCIASSDGSQYFKGRMAGVSLFTQELTAAEIAELDGGFEPVNTVAPAITGTEQDGQTLTCSTGTWDAKSNGSLSYTYQWYRADDTGGTNEAAISGATSSTYTAVTADVGKHLRCLVGASNNGGTDSTQDTFSGYTGAIAAAGGATVTGSVSESSIATDSATATLIGRESVNESATAADTPAVALTAREAVSESATASDSLGVTATIAAAVSESSQVSDQALGTVVTAGVVTGAVSELATAGDSVSARLIARESISESGQASDALGVIATLAGAVSESSIAADAVTGAIVGPATVTGAVAESAIATDVVSVRLIARAAVSEQATATEIIVGRVGDVPDRPGIQFRSRWTRLQFRSSHAPLQLRA